LTLDFFPAVLVVDDDPGQVAIVTSILQNGGLALHPDLKVLYVTAQADELFRQTHELHGHEAFLEKPVSVQRLREAVTLLLRR
jgi:CheY-like chemotaxis protein